MTWICAADADDARAVYVLNLEHVRHARPEGAYITRFAFEHETLRLRIQFWQVRDILSDDPGLEDAQDSGMPAPATERQP